MKVEAILIFMTVTILCINGQSKGQGQWQGHEPGHWQGQGQGQWHGNGQNNCGRLCPAIYSPVCGYNGYCFREFGNQCELNLANCHGPIWKPAPLHYCRSNRRCPTINIKIGSKTKQQ